MGERAHHQAQRGGHQGPAQSLAAGDIEDVLDPGKPRRGDARVDQAVGQRVQLVAPPTGQHDQQEQPLGRFLDQRRTDREGPRTGTGFHGGGRVHHRLRHEFEEDRQHHRHRRAPQEGQHQQSWRLRFPAVQPQIGQQYHRHRDRGQDEADRGADRVHRHDQHQNERRQGAQRDDHSQRGADLPDLPRQRRNVGTRLIRLICPGGVVHLRRLAIRRRGVGAGPDIGESVNCARKGRDSDRAASLTVACAHMMGVTYR